MDEKTSKALSFWRRVKILEMIAEKSRYCEEIAFHDSMNVKPSGIHRHLTQLLGAELVETSKGVDNERNVLYLITDKGAKALKELPN